MKTGEYTKADVKVFGNESEWLAGRRGYITASEASVICNANSYSGRLKLWYEKAGIEFPYDDGDGGNKRREAGHRLENVIADWFSDDAGFTVVDPGDFALFTNPKYPGIAATLDRIFIDPAYGPGVLELKNPSEYRRDEYSNGQIPLHAQIQAQIQMLVTGLDHGVVAYLIGGWDFGWVPVKANPKFQAAIVRKISEFWKSIKAGTPPQPDGHPTDNEVLDRVHPNADGDILVGIELRDVYDEMVGIDEALRPLEKRKEELKAMVKSRMGEAQRAIGEGYVFSRSVSTSKAKLEIVAPEPKLGEIAAFLQGHSIPYVTKGGTVSVRLNKKGDKP